MDLASGEDLSLRSRLHEHGPVRFGLDSDSGDPACPTSSLPQMTLTRRQLPHNVMSVKAEIQRIRGTGVLAK
jgi:hypothetical protein